jgi:polysaccharide biosynthesis/export protein
MSKTKPSIHTRRAAGIAALSAITLLAGCAYAPGMKMSVEAPRATGPADVAERADVRAIDLALVQKLSGERTAKVSAGSPAGFATSAEAWQYKIAPQDVLRVTVWNHPELTNPSGTANELSGRVVNNDGSLFFPYAGNVQAGGRTVQEVRDVIARALRTVIKDPQVDVSVLQYRGQRLYIAGEVRTPGSQQITDVPADLTEVIARAGGLTPEADLAGATITRGNQSVKVDLYALYYNGDMRQNLRLAHGDVINVPERRSNKVFVLGEVIRPNSLVMPRGELTLAEALADVGGVNPLSANAGQVYVIRAGDKNRPQVFHLNAGAPDALLLADRFALNARDVVYVDAAPVVRWARLINNILPSADFVREALNDTTRAFPR